MPPRPRPSRFRLTEHWPAPRSGPRNLALALALGLGLVAAADAGPRPRVVVETDAGGDPDDEQSLVRLLLYANDLEIAGIVANRARAREGENRNPARTGIGILHRFADAYEQCWPRLQEHDPRYPRPAELRARMVDGTEAGEDGVNLLVREVDAADPRPLWFCNWGTDAGSSPSNLLRALDRVRLERGEEGYAAFKRRIRLSSADKFGAHTRMLEPPFPIWVDTFRPELDGRRWYHRFSAITAKAGGFDLRKDVLQDHGPLGALYPVNTHLPQKEGDTMTFLHLIPVGLADPEHPDWGGWSGRYERDPAAGGRRHYHATARDSPGGRPPSRDATLERWAEAIQRDFQARMDWCVSPRQDANHPPEVAVLGDTRREVRPGRQETVDASPTRDADGNEMEFDWFWYPEAGTFAGQMPALQRAGRTVTFTAPAADAPASMHLVLAVTDRGSPRLTRYARIVFSLRP